MHHPACPRVVLAALLLAFPIAVRAADPAKPAYDWANHPENQWVKQSPRDGAPAPGFSWEGSGSYDPHSKQWIHFGGHDGIPQGFPLFTYDLETARWRQHFPNTSPPGVCCVDGANVFDIAHQRFVCFPGGSLGHGWQWSRGVKLKRSHVWLYDLPSNTWTNMRPPPYREPDKNSRSVLGSLDAAATYDANHELAISFGGQGNGGGMNNLFVYDAYANRLERLAAANPPSERDGMGLAYDSANDCLVLFGSQYASDEKTWIYRYRTNKWESHDLDPHPPGKKAGTYSTIPKMAFDTHNNVNVCLTWDTNTSKHETWAFDAGKRKWTKMNPATEPAPSMSRSRNLSYSAEHNVFILETTTRAEGPQLWTYRYKKAPPDPRPAAPTNLAVLTDRDRATLTWTASATPGVRDYEVYRAEAELSWLAEFKKIAATRATTYEDAKLTPGKVYLYRVHALADGTASRPSFLARTQPRVLLRPVVSVLAKDRVEVSWTAHPAKDIAGYNLYRGLVSVQAVQRGTPSPWRDNDPEYPEPLVVAVRDITKIEKLNAALIEGTTFADTKVDLARKQEPEPGEYAHAVYAYILKAVNRLGTESGPSPYALTLASEPPHVLLREKDGMAEIKWERNPEKGITGYRIYKKGNGTFDILRLPGDPVQGTTFTDKNPGSKTRYWVVPVDALGQEGQPSSPVWYGQRYKGFFDGEWHQ